MDSELDWISREELRLLTDAHATTVARWKRHATAGRLPRWLYLLVHVVHRGRLGPIHRDWRGWLISTHDGTLVTPEGTSVTMGQIRALPFLYAQLHALRAELSARRAAPTPGFPALPRAAAAR